MKNTLFLYKQPSYLACQITHPALRGLTLKIRYALSVSVLQDSHFRNYTKPIISMAPFVILITVF
jgi:hypothetical protein